MRPTRSNLLLLSLALVGFVLAVSPLCLGLVFGARRVDFFHLTVFDACAMQARELHWQNPQRLTQTLRYDFALVPDSFLFIEFWIADGPTLSFSQPLPKTC